MPVENVSICSGDCIAISIVCSIVGTVLFLVGIRVLRRSSKEAENAAAQRKAAEFRCKALLNTKSAAGPLCLCDSVVCDNLNM